MKKRSLLQFLAVAGLLYAAYAVAGIGDLGPVDSLHARRAGNVSFSPMAWQDADQAERGRMVARLAAKYRFVGRPREEVLALLGPSECYAHYKDEPCYSLRFGARRVDLVFGVNHSNAPGMVVSMSLRVWN